VSHRCLSWVYKAIFSIIKSLRYSAVLLHIIIYIFISHRFFDDSRYYNIDTNSLDQIVVISFIYIYIYNFRFQYHFNIIEKLIVISVILRITYLSFFNTKSQYNLKETTTNHRGRCWSGTRPTFIVPVKKRNNDDDDQSYL
jgi:hypothetical protein